MDDPGAARVLVVEHGGDDGPYALGEALASAGATVQVVRVHADEALPANCSGLAGLVVLGGVMAAYSDEGFPTRRAEIELLAEAVDLDLPVLGLCLGAQLLAVATGGSAFKGHELEIGWTEVATTPDASADPLFARLADRFSVMQWHGDTFEMPPGAVRLAASSSYENQAFRLGERAWGVQFHAEITAETLERWGSGLPEGALGAGETLLGAAGVLEAFESDVATPLLGSFARLVAGPGPAAGTVPSASRSAHDVEVTGPRT